MNELIVSSNEEGLRIGILEDRRIVELHYEKTNKLFSVGDMFLGKVKKIVPGLNAAFVEVGHPRDAFLHHLDLGPNVRTLQKYVKSVQSSKNNITPLGDIKLLPEIKRDGKIGQVFKSNQPILVQVEKEAISTKGPRLTCEVSIPGQYVIIVPFGNETSVSRKIRSTDEKKRLKEIVNEIRPLNFGVIVRTAAEGREKELIQQDLEKLISKWDRMCVSIADSRPPKRVLSEVGRTTSIIRDMLGVGFDAILTDNRETYNEIHDYLQRNMPGQVKILKFFKGKGSVFEARGLEKQIKASFGKTVTMRNGSYLVIEHTEALHVIDVNSGSKNLQGSTLEDNALKINTVAAEEIARQLRLRDMGGIIVIDFIDLKKPDNRKALFATLKEAMKRDPAKHSILPMSRFGLVQVTRQRVRPQLNISTSEMCPCCSGSGKIQPSILITDEIKNNVDFLMKQNKEKLVLYTHPFVESFLTKGFYNQLLKWRFKYGKSVKVISDDSLPLMEVKYFNGKGVEIQF